MKYFSFLLFAFVMMMSCKSENTLRDNATTPITPNSVNNPVTPATPAAPAATANIPGGAHYVCTKAGCTGAGASGAGNCAVCSGTLSHNQAFHNNNNNAAPAAVTTTNANSGLSPLFNNGAAASDASATPQITTTPAAEPAQNANGIWHYTCSNGCAGGGGSAIACGSCGSTLAHNTAYH